jgi:hypothetical protein
LSVDELAVSEDVVFDGIYLVPPETGFLYGAYDAG